MTLYSTSNDGSRDDAEADHMPLFIFFAFFFFSHVLSLASSSQAYDEENEKTKPKREQGFAMQERNSLYHIYSQVGGNHDLRQRLQSLAQFHAI